MNKVGHSAYLPKYRCSSNNKELAKVMSTRQKG